MPETQLSMLIDKDLYDALRVEAARQGTTRKAAVEAAFRLYLERCEAERQRKEREKGTK